MNEFQQPVNPLAPEMGATAEQMLSYFMQRSAGQRNETPEAIPVSFNPFQPEQPTQQESQDKHVSNMEQFLSPIKMDAFDINTEYTDEKHDNFLQNLEEDPAVQEYGPQYHAYLESLLGAVKAGQISQEDAVNLGQDYLNNVVKPVIKKHHKSDSYEKGLHRKREPEIPEIIKKIKGVK
ncbi:hypothetical protein OL383_004431 [Salmonella enterica]|nr:hypothetical protein [Salmonella enterica]